MRYRALYWSNLPRGTAQDSMIDKSPRCATDSVPVGKHMDGGARRNEAWGRAVLQAVVSGAIRPYEPPPRSEVGYHMHRKTANALDLSCNLPVVHNHCLDCRRTCLAPFLI